MCPLKIHRHWSYHIPNAMCLEVDREGNQIFVADHNKQLHLLDIKGHITTVVLLPHTFVSVEASCHHDYGTVLLGNTDCRVYVINCEGRVLWRYPKWLPTFGINGAHWGDINGDGTDEIVLGLNGGGGLLAFTGEGRPLWKIKKMKNVWSHTIIPSCHNQESLLLATEASGQIYLYNSKGQGLRTLRPEGGYFTEIVASVVDCKTSVQIAALALRENNIYDIVIFNLNGKILYKTSTLRLFMKRVFVSEDLNGDGTKEWAFVGRSGELTFLSSQGEILTTLAGQQDLDDFLIIPQSNGRGILLTLQAGTVQAYFFSK